VATVNLLNDGDGVISKFNTNIHVFNVNSSQELTFVGLHVVAILGNIVFALGE